MRDLLCVCLLLQLPGTIPTRAPASHPCLPVCWCREDGSLLQVDCSERALTLVPLGLSPYTSYLDLSMNNISELQPMAFQNLHSLLELRLSGNSLKHIPSLAFSGLYNLEVLMLQNNQLELRPSSAVWDLPSLLSLRLDGNQITEVPEQTFSRLPSLRHLWLDDNVLMAVPGHALAHLPSLQALTLALNRILHIPDTAFHNLSNLVVLYLHDNRIQTLGSNCFDGLHGLEILDLKHNQLQEIPTAIRMLANLRELGFNDNQIQVIPEEAFAGNPLLRMINFYENPIRYVSRMAFQHLPNLHTLTLSGGAQISHFLDLKGTANLEALYMTRANLAYLPQSFCQQLTGLKLLELSHNQILALPNFCQCQQLQEIKLQHNLIQEIGVWTFHQLSSLHSLDLSYNRISNIHQGAFASLQSLRKLDLTNNLLASLPSMSLHSLSHLKLGGNRALSEIFRKEDFPEMRIIEMPYAYQCCVFGACSNQETNRWEHKTSGSMDEDPQGKAVAVFSVLDDMELKKFLLQTLDPKIPTSVQCTPIPGPFKPCSYFFDSWVFRMSVWAVAVVSLVCNTVLVFAVFTSPSDFSAVKFLLGSLGGTSFLVGLCTATLALLDAVTFGEFSQYGALWESSTSCQVVGFLSTFATQASIFLIGLAVIQCSIHVSNIQDYGMVPSATCVKVPILCCGALSLTTATLPLFGIGQYGSSPLCLLSPLPESQPSDIGFTVGLIAMNTLCFFILTCTCIKLYCSFMKEGYSHLRESMLFKHVALLVFANSLLYCPMTFVGLSILQDSLHISEYTIKFIQLVLLPLPASLNPLIYLIFSPLFKEDLQLPQKTSQSAVPVTLDSFCFGESTQALVLPPDAEGLVEVCERSNTHWGPSTVPCYQMTHRVLCQS
ncbi:leucine-rich repeat-containing G-protein coupled receptor 6-like [Paramormyrops kingsleyae]|uniref:leucine-rich repeat-containing G-protein coupled receptor 6-like n=1 Tax=Paramormyrops kingsleyae TaxID=1676925 RepID=UPI003B96E6B8